MRKILQGESEPENGDAPFSGRFSLTTVSSRWCSRDPVTITTL